MNNRNPILEEIWRTREEIARESSHDIHAMAAAARQREARLLEQGWKLVSFAEEDAPISSCLVREEPPST